MRLQIAVVGASQPSRDAANEAEAVGAAIAEAGATLVCGGLGGIMEAAAKGARQKGGLTLGILPGNSRRDANPYIDCAVATGLGDFRNYLVVATANAVVAMPGRYGTLSEIAMALTLVRRGSGQLGDRRCARGRESRRSGADSTRSQILTIERVR